MKAWLNRLIIIVECYLSDTLRILICSLKKIGWTNLELINVKKLYLCFKVMLNDFIGIRILIYLLSCVSMERILQSPRKFVLQASLPYHF